MQTTEHTRAQAAVFSIKRQLLQLRRLGMDLGGSARRHRLSPIDSTVAIAAESRTNLWMDASHAERNLQLGKVHNLRLALRQINGLKLGAGETFSFWAQIGRASRTRGYVPGRELREGCIIPAIGGGLCQLSNALYDLALRADCEIVERHAHSRVVPGSAAESGRDATVAWNYIDLRFRAKTELQIEAFLTRDELVIRFRGMSPVSASVVKRRELRLVQETGSCVTCGQDECFRHAPEMAWVENVESTYLVDAVWPEWQAYIEGTQGKLLAPIDGRLFNMPRYGWDSGLLDMKTAPLAALRRALSARRTAGMPPPVVRLAQLEADAEVALALARKLRSSDEHVTVAQSFLPALWSAGYLGGRRFSVLMTRLPMGELQRRLDEALERFPDQKLLGDFRAPEEMVRAEAEALAEADQIITPHPGIASLYPGRALLLPWRTGKPPSPPTPSPSRHEHPARRGGLTIGFPGPTAARKGAYAVRKAAQRLGVPVAVGGKNLEGSGFWDSVQVTNDLSQATVIVQPSISEDRSIALLKAQKAGIPIIATDMCGLAEGEYHRVDFGDVDAIVEKLNLLLG